MSITLLEVNETQMQLIGHGAEGKVFATIFLGRPTIVKERVPKKYRVKELDQKLTLQRLRQEARCMVKCRRAGVLTPRLASITTCTMSRLPFILHGICSFVMSRIRRL